MQRFNCVCIDPCLLQTDLRQLNLAGRRNLDHRLGCHLRHVGDKEGRDSDAPTRLRVGIGDDRREDFAHAGGTSALVRVLCVHLRSIRQDWQTVHVRIVIGCVCKLLSSFLPPDPTLALQNIFCRQIGISLSASHVTSLPPLIRSGTPFHSTPSCPVNVSLIADSPKRGM